MGEKVKQTLNDLLRRFPHGQRTVTVSREWFAVVHEALEDGYVLIRKTQGATLYGKHQPMSYTLELTVAGEHLRRGLADGSLATGEAQVANRHSELLALLARGGGTPQRLGGEWHAACMRAAHDELIHFHMEVFEEHASQAEPSRLTVRLTSRGRALLASLETQPGHEA
jgi:hypothetical protein